MLHPQSIAAIEAQRSEPKVTDPDFDVVAARAADRVAALAATREEVEHVADLEAAGVLVRHYCPTNEPAGLVLHLHGAAGKRAQVLDLPSGRNGAGGPPSLAPPIR